MASRANIITGMYEYKTGCNFDKGDLSLDKWQLSYPVLLRESGYITGFAGKIGFEVDGHDVSMDFDSYGGSPGQTSYKTEDNLTMAHYAKEYPHSTLSYGAFGRDFIRQAASTKKPFCLSISFKAPHRPPQPDHQFDAIYANKVFSKPPNFGREYGEHFSMQSKQGRQWERFHTWNYDTDYDGVMRIYHQLIYGIDVAVGMIRDELDKQGLAENTIIFYTSDNGYFNGAHGYGSKVLPYEEPARVPLMIYDPRNDASVNGNRSEALTGNIDFAPTILQLAGLPVPENIDGNSLLPLLDDPSVEVREQLALINTWGAEPTQSLAVITKDWKYIYWWYKDEAMQPVEELFHTSSDPYELRNLAISSECEVVLKAMRERYNNELCAWKQQAVDKYKKFGTLFERRVDF